MPLPAMLAAALPTYTLPPDLLARARFLSHLDAALYFGGTVWALLVLGLLLRGRTGETIAGWAHRVIADRQRLRPFLEGFLVAPAWLLLLALIALPGELLGHRAALHFGLSVERWPAWWGDWLKGELLQLLFGTLILSGVFLLLRRSPRFWWAWLWLLAQPFVVLGVYLAPTVLDPIFNRFTPLQQADPALVVRLEQLVRLGGLSIPPERMFVEDASRRATGMNAYVTGIGGSKRIVVWDTTLHKVPQDEILAIYAHEQGHYVLHHIPEGIAFSAALTLLLLVAAGQFHRLAIRRFGNRWHIGDESDWAALPWLLLLAVALNFLAAPAANAFSRMEEGEADVYGQQLLSRVLPNTAEVEVRDFIRLGTAWLEDPAPNGFLVWWTYTHPPTADRVAAAVSLSSK